MIEIFFICQKSYGITTQKKITQKKQIQLLVRAQEGIQINFFSVRLKIFLIDFYQTRQVFRPRERIEKFYRIIYKLGSHSLGHIKSMLECQKCCGHGFFSCRPPKKKKSPGMKEVLIKHKTIKWTPNGKALPIRPRGKI